MDDYRAHRGPDARFRIALVSERPRDRVADAPRSSVASASRLTTDTAALGAEELSESDGSSPRNEQRDARQLAGGGAPGHALAGLTEGVPGRSDAC